MRGLGDVYWAHVSILRMINDLNCFVGSAHLTWLELPRGLNILYELAQDISARFRTKNGLPLICNHREKIGVSVSCENVF